MTQSIEIGMLIALTGSIVGLVTFLAGRQSAAKKDGEFWGTLKTDIDYIKRDVSYTRSVLDAYSKKNDAAIARLHKRIDDHLTKDHNII